jgi:hypothetical protein
VQCNGLSFDAHNPVRIWRARRRGDTRTAPPPPITESQRRPPPIAFTLVSMYIVQLYRVANLGDFSPKNANLGIFLAFEELGIFRGILKVSYNRAFSVKYSKNMRISASQNMFRPIFQVIYHKIYT